MKDYNNYDEYKEGYKEGYNKGFNEDYFYDEELEYKRNRRKLRLFKVISTLTIIIFAMVAIFIAFPGINKDKEEKIMEDYKKVQDVKVPTDSEPTADPHEGMAKSLFTGLWIDENVVNNRPVAIMFNNIKEASPQSGTSEMDILYEAVVEGGITRLMGISQNVNSNRIGSLRSARPYYVSIAKEYDAIYIHVGGSTDAKNKIASLGLTDFDGNTGKGSAIMYRDNSIRAPHNAFTSKERIDKLITSNVTRTDYEGKTDNHFTFNDEVQSIKGDGKAKSKVALELSGYAKPYFTYNETDKLYYRYQFDTAHIDKNTGKQLSFANIIIQYVKQWTYDSHGRQAMDFYDSNGEGIYISAGEYKNIRWKRNESRRTMQYLEDGQLLQVNPGKTYIALVPNDKKEKTTIY